MLGLAFKATVWCTGIFCYYRVSISRATKSVPQGQNTSGERFATAQPATPFRTNTPRINVKQQGGRKSRGVSRASDTELLKTCGQEGVIHPLPYHWSRRPSTCPQTGSVLGWFVCEIVSVTGIAKLAALRGLLEGRCQPPVNSLSFRRNRNCLTMCLPIRMLGGEIALRDGRSKADTTVYPSLTICGLVLASMVLRLMPFP